MWTAFCSLFKYMSTSYRVKFHNIKELNESPINKRWPMKPLESFMVMHLKTFPFMPLEADLYEETLCLSYTNRGGTNGGVVRRPLHI